MKKKRTSCRRSATILVHRVEVILDNGSGDDEWEKLEHFIEELTERRGELKRLDEEIIDILLEDAEDQEIEKDNDEANEYREKIGCTILATKKAIQKLETQAKWGSRLMESLNPKENSNGGDKKLQVKLPKFNLKPFSGRVHEWQEFWDSFNSAIHQNESLANVEKLNYLRGYLEDKARSVIA